MRLLLRAALLCLAVPLAAEAANPVVRFTTELGSYDVELCNEVSTACEAAVPTSVANFLGYLDRGDYAGSVIHRSTTLGSAGVVVIQGGGFRREAVDAIRRVPAKPAIANEFHQSNQRGTMAYARMGGQPGSATSQWFINVIDNTVLDTIDGGFTVFGVVIDGMQTVDAISALQRININAPYLDPLFGPDPVAIASNFTETPFPDAFYDLIAGVEDPADLPPPVDFAEAMIEPQIARVPEPAAAAAGLLAAATLAALARHRARRR